MTETWKPIVGRLIAYEVSDLGRVRNRNGRILKPTPVGKGYLRVRIVGRDRYIHHLVLESFVGPCPLGMQACHNNGDKTDNRSANLRWDTPSSNNRDQVKHGTNFNASKTDCAQGHEYTPENTIRTKAGRTCLTCKRTQSRRAMREKLSTPEGRAKHAAYVHEWRRRTGRVDGLGNQHARRTHCNNGHEFTPENTAIRSDGGRRCKTCKNRRATLLRNATPDT